MCEVSSTVASHGRPSVDGSCHYIAVPKPLSQEVANYSAQTKPGPSPIFVNKVLSEQSRHSLVSYVWLLSLHDSRFE